MDFIEFTGKTVDDALTNALVEFGVTSDQIEYEVLEKGSSGFLGFNSKIISEISFLRYLTLWDWKLRF